MKDGNQRLLNLANLACAAIASTDKTRYVLQGVYCDKTRTVATEGHLLLSVDYPADVTPTEFPAVGQAEPSGEWRPVIVPTEQMNALKKNLPKRSTLPVLLTALLYQTEKETLAATTDLDTKQVLTVKPVEETYPAVDVGFPKVEAAKIRIAFDPKLMLKLCQALIACGVDGQHNPVTMGIKDGLSPMRFDAKSADGQAVVGVLMPCRM